MIENIDFDKKILFSEIVHFDLRAYFPSLSKNAL